MTRDTIQSCRVCRSSKNTHDMYLLEEKLKTKVEIICSIELRDDDVLKYICHDCKTTIESSFRLRQLAQIEAKVKDPIGLTNVIQENEVSEDESDKYSFNDNETSFVEEEPFEEIECDEDIFKVKSEVSKLSDADGTCRLCRRSVKQVYLDDHESKCNGKLTKYKCPFKSCNKRFVQRKSLKLHAKSQHFNER